MKLKTIASWILRLVAALILLQTLYFKFSAHPESVALFTKLGVEPWGRIGTGVLELITAILLILPTTVFIGAFLGSGIMGGAILSHISIIGIESKGDGGQLFLLAILVLLFCTTICIMHWKQGILIYNKILKSKK